MTASSLPLPSLATQPMVRVPRLIVLLPFLPQDTTGLVRQILEVVNPAGQGVLLFSLCVTAGRENQMRRDLVILAAMLKEAEVPVGMRVERGWDWVGRIRQTLQPGDALACVSGARTGLLGRPLVRVLQDQLNLPIRILSGAGQEEKRKTA